MRLNAYLAKSGVASRRGADELIKSSQVKVNGRAGHLNDDVSEKDTVEVNGEQVKLQKSRYILLNKPAGYVTTLKDPKNRPKVTDLLDVPERIVPVGRLDYDTSGALLLTNDGELAHHLMHPSFNVDKVYEVTVEGSATEEILNKLSNGVELEDGKTAPAQVRKIGEHQIELTIHEGRKRQVKRMINAVGLNFVALHRPQYGPLTVDGLLPGQWRNLTSTELKMLQG